MLMCLSDWRNMLYQPLFTYEGSLQLINFSSISVRQGHTIKVCLLLLQMGPCDLHHVRGHPSIGPWKSRNEISLPMSSLSLILSPSPVFQL